ncbi:SH3 domain-containing protein [Macrococcoides caseolyticum]|uniref:SH3 domain-containing protein n=1 Tax=Macrococcoides caseolyticum TaxID=69966 RepID=UPI001F2104BA|nr:SH3 domain-containing protein [Macrococcus caseolyticus]MCE4957729.1 SH3 domain-containing protein [Macrococcus caseolyticus]
MAKQFIGNWNGVPVYTDFLPIGTRRTGQRLDSGVPKFAVFHDTGNKDTTAQQNVNYYKNTYNIDLDHVASAHFFVDDKECIICIPVTEKAWHVLYNTPTDNSWYGDDANDIAFGGEVSYFSNVAQSRKALDNACRVFAALFNSWSLNPKTQLPGHQDIQADKIDPGNLLEACGYGRHDMSVIDNLIVKYMKGDSPTPKVAPAPQKVVRKSPTKQVASTINKGGWTVSQYGTKIKKEKGTFTVTVTDGITCRYLGPNLNNPVSGTLKKGQSVKYDTVYVAVGYVWISWIANDKKRVFMPIRTHKNGVDGQLWGTIK